MFAWQDDKFVLPTEHLERGQPREVFLSQHRERELTWSEKDHIIAAIASGLRYALRRGVIHRDVRPHNIVIAPGGQVKLDLAIHEPASGAAARCPALAASDFAIGSSTQGQPRPYASRHIRSSSLPERDLPPRATKFTNRPG